MMPRAPESALFWEDHLTSEQTPLREAAWLLSQQAGAEFQLLASPFTTFTLMENCSTPVKSPTSLTCKMEITNLT